MSDTYYRHEEDVESPETQLDNFRAQEGASEAVVVWARETLGNIYDKTLEMWNAAGERGDLETQTGLNELYKGAEHMQQNLLHTNSAMKSVLEAAAALAKQKAEIEKDLNILAEAVDNGDNSDPRVASLMEQVEAEVYEFIEFNGGYDMNEDSSDYDNIVADLCKNIRVIAPQTTHAVAERFFATLVGDYAMNDIQRGLLLSLLNTITLDTD